MACGTSVSGPGTEPGPLAVKAQSPNHWGTPLFSFYLIKNALHNSMESFLFGLLQKRIREKDRPSKIIMLKFDIVRTLTKEAKFRTLISKLAIYLNADASLCSAKYIITQVQNKVRTQISLCAMKRVGDGYARCRIIPTSPV